jgi:hypothetical protein
MNTKRLKESVKSFSGLVLILFIAAAALTYFSNTISISHFTTIAFMVAIVATALAYFGWLTMRAGILFVVMAVVLLLGIIYVKQPAVKTSQFQAVFLTSGQAYFGHLSDPNSSYMVLTDVYYLQSNQQNPQSGSTATTSPQVVLEKLGNQIHAPENQMAIKSDQVLFWENLQNSGKVVQAIEKNQYK